jgi:two-component system sensor histidine kinase CpxA
VAAGDLSVRVAHTVGNRTDEIAELAHDFDAMTERVEALLQSQQRLMRDVSHELRSPLARLQALLSIARQNEGAVAAAHIDRMEVELERLDELIGEILAYARLEALEEPARHPTDIVDLLQNIVDDATLEGQSDGQDVRLEAPDRCVIEVDSSLIQSAVENVVRNALRYTARGTVIDVRATVMADGVHIVVDDRGPGVPPEAMSQLFEPFYRVENGRDTASGTGGIGLAIAMRGVRLHGGTIAAREREGGGLSVEMILPQTPAQPDGRSKFS